MPLPRQAKTDGIFDGKKYNVFDVNTKEIVFTGGFTEVSKFLGIAGYNSLVYYYIKNKRRYKNKYAIRVASDKKPG